MIPSNGPGNVPFFRKWYYVFTSGRCQLGHRLGANLDTARGNQTTKLRKIVLIGISKRGSSLYHIKNISGFQNGILESGRYHCFDKNPQKTNKPSRDPMLIRVRILQIFDIFSSRAAV